MKRFIERQLEDWKQSPRRKPLIMRATRITIMADIGLMQSL